MLSEPLLRALADGRFHSCVALAGKVGADLAVIDQALAALADAGLEIQSSGEGAIALGRPIEWIDANAVLAVLDATTRARVERMDCLFQHESTNRYLLDVGPPPPGRLTLATAEFQFAGRGRRGRYWSMPPGGGIALSAAWRFSESPRALAAFSLAVGAAVRRAIRDTTGASIGLKWPNDLYADGGKLGGILVELEPLHPGATHVVVGVGINVDVAAAQLARISDLPGGARDLARCAGHTPDRNRLVAALVTRLTELFAGFIETGFEPYHSEWTAAHILDGVAVALHRAQSVETGIVRGIDADGALIVEDATGNRQRHTSGDVTVRMTA